MPEVRSCTKQIISKGRHRTCKPFMRLVAKTINVKQKQGWTRLFSKDYSY